MKALLDNAMRHQSEAAPTSSVKAYTQQDTRMGQENCCHEGPSSYTVHTKKPGKLQMGPVPSTASLRHRLPLQPLSSNHQASASRAAAKHLQVPSANCQQPVSFQLPSTMGRHPLGLPSDLSSTCEPPTSHEQSVVVSPAADCSSKQSELQDSLAGSRDKVALVPDTGHADGAGLSISGSTQATQEPPEQLPAYLTVQVSCPQQPRSLSNYPTSSSTLAAAHLPVSPTDSQDNSRPDAAPAAGLVSRAEAALQRIHAQHPVTHIMQQKLAADNIPAPAAGGPALQLHNSSIAETTPPGPIYCTQKQPVLHHSMRGVAECGNIYFQRSGPNCPLLSTTAPAAAGTKSTSSAAPAEQVQQMLDAVRSKLQFLEAMQLDQRIPPPALAVAVASAATLQGDTVHTAAPFAVRQQTSSHQREYTCQRGQQDLQLPTVKFPSSLASSISRPCIKDKTNFSTGGSILDGIAVHLLANQRVDANSRPAYSMPVINTLSKSRVAALAASALAAGAIKRRPTSAEAPGYNAPQVPGSARLAGDYIGPQPGQDWKHWRAAAGTMMVQQAPPPLEAAGTVPKLQAAAMPQFLQQHVVMAKRAAASLLQQQAVVGGTETHSAQQQDGNLSGDSSQGSCMSMMVTPKSAEEHLQQQCPAAYAGNTHSAVLQSLMGQQLAASEGSRVGNTQVVAPLHSSMMHAAGTAAVAVAQQQTAFAARVLQRLQAQHASHYQNRTMPAIQNIAAASTYLVPSEGSSAFTVAGAGAVNQPAVSATRRLAKQQAEDSSDAADGASPAQSNDSFHSCLQDTAESQMSYLLAPHMLRRTPFVGVGDQGYEAKDFDYIEYAKRRMHAEPHARDVFFVRDRRYESERLKQGARKKLTWTRQRQGK